MINQPVIFATVGTQLPFDRLVIALDNWAARNQNAEVFVQLGRTTYQPRYMNWAHDIEPEEFKRRVATSDVVVAHAGMGSIISAVETGKQIVVMPRRASLGEHRNDHQLATASRMSHLDGLAVVHDKEQLETALAARSNQPGKCASMYANTNLIAAVRRFAGLGAI